MPLTTTPNSFLVLDGGARGLWVWLLLPVLLESRLLGEIWQLSVGRDSQRDSVPIGSVHRVSLSHPSCWVALGDSSPQLFPHDVLDSITVTTSKNSALSYFITLDPRLPLPQGVL